MPSTTYSALNAGDLGQRVCNNKVNVLNTLNDF